MGLVLWFVDLQVHPVISRLCAPMEGTDAARLADCLGLDPVRYRGSGTAIQSADDARADALLSSGASLDDDSLYKVRELCTYRKLTRARACHDA